MAPRLPWVSVRGDYLAYDYQRGLLATRRFADLLGVRLDAAAEHRHARQKLDVPASPALAEAAAGRIAITLGGVQPHRVYCGWPDVARALVARGHRRIALLGSSNGAALAHAVRAALAGGDADVLDLVGKTDIAVTRNAMAASAAVLAVDGGLMHLACTTETPMLALFDATSLPVWRVPPDFDGRTLVSASADVNGIAPGAVVDAALALFDARGIAPDTARD
nr:glycosyltransferase family 9 protein [Schlegelella koreensis]